MLHREMCALRKVCQGLLPSLALVIDFVCTTGVLKQFGDVGVALAYVSPEDFCAAMTYMPTRFRTLAIALHTFFTLVFRWRPDPASKLPLLVVSAIWIILALFIGISFATHRHKVYYGDTQYCKFASDCSFPSILSYMLPRVLDHI